MKLTRDGFAVHPEGVMLQEDTAMPEPTLAMNATGDGTKANVQNLLECMRSRKTPNAHIRAAVEAAYSSQMAIKAMRERRIVVT